MADEFFTVDQVAERLQLSPRTIHRWIAEGKLHKATLPGRAVRIPARELERLRGERTEGDPKAAPDV